MASRSAQTYDSPVQVRLVDGSVFVCTACGNNEFRMTSDEAAPLHLFCRCGQVYTTNDLPPLEGS